jgi:hypothetical protein
MLGSGEVGPHPPYDLELERSSFEMERKSEHSHHLQCCWKLSKMKIHKSSSIMRRMAIGCCRRRRGSNIGIIGEDVE